MFCIEKGFIKKMEAYLQEKNVIGLITQSFKCVELVEITLSSPPLFYLWMEVMKKK